jgi:hypothetical protein
MTRQSIDDYLKFTGILQHQKPKLPFYLERAHGGVWLAFRAI